MAVHLITHDFSLGHRTPAGHPERVERVTSVIDAVKASSHDVVEWDAPAVDMALLETIHTLRSLGIRPTGHAAGHAEGAGVPGEGR